uniref:GTPase n=1 Tax=Pseudomonas proteolytica TaxID=219574 RepID=UPI003BB7CDE5
MSFEPEDIEAARKLFAGPIAFLKSAPPIEFLPDAVVPEVAFAGRSNVVKSSLLNALTGRNALARTSNTPGRAGMITIVALRMA